MIKPRLEIKFPIKYAYWFLKRKSSLRICNDTLLVNRARTGIIISLKALNLPQNSKVGMMCYNCKSVMNAIHHCGFHIVFIDVTDSLKIDLNDLNRKSKGLSALIITHLFGIPNDIAEIKKVIPNIPIIEDCAHAFGSVGCGEGGDFAVYSLGLGKFPSIGNGGVLRINNSIYQRQSAILYNSLKDYSTVDDFKLFLHLMIRHIIYMPILYNFLTNPFIRQYRHSNVIEIEDMKKMSLGIASIFSHIQNGLQQEMFIRWERLVHLKEEFANNTDCKLIFDAHSNGFMAPFICRDKDALKYKLKRQNIESETHFSNCIVWAKEFGYNIGDCPNTERLLSKLLILPTYYELPL